MPVGPGAGVFWSFSIRLPSLPGHRSMVNVPLPSVAIPAES
jgi:hypothetical protein